MRISAKMMATVAALLVTVTACSATRDGTGSSSGRPAEGPGQSSATRAPTGIAEPTTNVPPSSAAARSMPSALKPRPKPIHVSLLKSDGGSRYWEKSGHAGAAVEAHYQPAHYWLAHATIRITTPLKGLPGGAGLAYDDRLTLAMVTGAANIATLDGHTERMTVTSDGKKDFSFPVSLGAADHPPTAVRRS